MSAGPIERDEVAVRTPPPGPRRRVLRQAGAAALALAGAGCGGRRSGSAGPLDFWAMGREAEVVAELLPGFRARHPGIDVHLQQLPWSAAHEKLLTAYAGGSLPDVAQLGNTWLPEFAALDALQPLDGRIEAAGVPLADYFPGILDTQRMPSRTTVAGRPGAANAGAGSDAAAGSAAAIAIAATTTTSDRTGNGTRLLGLPWYVDTRLLFYRSDLLAAAGWQRPPRDWAEWRAAMAAIVRRGGPGHYGALLPLNEPDPLLAFALQQGEVLAEGDTRGAFSRPAFGRALDFYASLFRDGLAPAVGETQIANLWDEFGRGVFGFYITGPWNIGEFRRRLPAERQGDWATAPLPGPTGPGVSTAGGASLVMFRGSPRKDAGWALIAYLSETATMQRFHALTGNLPPRRSAWASPGLANDRPSRAFAEQLERLRPAPKIPEWERIFQEMQATAERVVRGVQPAAAATAELDAWVDALLEKRRWLIDRRARPT